MATLVGFGAVLLWSLLALLTVGAAPVPPLLLNTICFAIGGVIGLVWVAVTTGFSVLGGVSSGVYVFGTIGLFGYHFFYFSALRLAPPAEAGLIAYLWPLFIVLFSGLLPGEQLRKGHILGAVLAFAGAALIVLQNAGGMSAQALPGLALAFLCAFTWSGYSVLSRRMGSVPTAVVSIYCVATAGLSLIAHLLFEQTIWPETPLSWVSVVMLGLGPVGLAFYIWDLGVKRGDIQLLGVASYAAPLLSTVVLVASGVAAPSGVLFAAALLIAGGAALAAWASAAKR